MAYHCAAVLRDAPQKINRRAAFGVGLVTLLLCGGVFVAQSMKAQADTTQFSFGAIGDQGLTSQTTAVVQAMGGANLNFVQQLGDLSYDSNPTGWCQYIKDNLNIGAGQPTGNTYGETFPYQLMAGNHESDSADNLGSLIEEYVPCLPNRLTITESPHLGTNPSSIGNYAKEFYYDYPASTPIARMIVTSPGLHYTYGGNYDYTVGSQRYQWLSNAIDSARASGIKWVIVASHKNYITTGEKSDEIGADYFNLLVEKNVDLLLQGHDHTYQRSKQLKTSASCTSVPSGTADSACIADDGADGNYDKNNGLVTVIAGSGGFTYYSTSMSDGDAPYFAAVMPDNNQTAGYFKVTVSNTALAGQYVGVTGGTYSDAFTINAPATDTTAPTVALSAPTAGATVDLSADLAATASDDTAVTKVAFYQGTTLLGEDTTAPYSYTWDTSGVTNGSYTLSAKAYDAAGNVGTSSSVTITVAHSAPGDTTAPSVSLTAPLGGTTFDGSVPMSASANDDTGVVRVEFYEGSTKLGETTASPYTYTWNTTAVTAGPYTITARAYDAAGNVGTSSPPASITISHGTPGDTTAPTVSVTAPAEGTALSGTASVTASASDDTAVTKVAFYQGTTLLGEDTSAPYSYSWDTTSVSNGSYNVSAKAYDAAGNVGTSAAVTVTVSNSAPPTDTTAPTVALTAPAAGATADTDIVAAATASDAVGVTKVAFYQGTTLLGEDTTAPYSYTWDTSGVTNGSYTLSAKAYDAAGNVGTSSSVTITVAHSAPGDTTAPSVSLTAPAAGANVTGVTALTATASDDTAVTKVAFYQGTTLLGEDTTAPYSYTWDTSGVTNGSYTLSAKAYDAAGNVGTSPSASITVSNPTSGGGDTTAPTVTLSAPQAGTTADTSVSMAATATDNTAVTKVAFYQGTTLLGEDTTAPFTYTWAATGVTAGTYSLSAKAYDAAGNVGTSASVSITIAHAATPPPAQPVQFNVTNSSAQTTATVSLSGACAQSATGQSSAAPSSLSDKTVLVGLAFTSQCSSQGGTVQVTINLGKRYDTLSSLKVYKASTNGTLQEITTAATIEDRTTNGTTTTFVIYSVTDGGSGDSDGLVNGVVVDPAYVVAAASTPAGTPAAATNTSTPTLLNTGAPVTLTTIAALGLLTGAIYAYRQRRAYALRRR